MLQKQVKILGLSVNKQLGILKACHVSFRETGVIAAKGGVGQGKTTFMTAIQLGTQGTKTLIDKDLYGAVDTEVPLSDGEHKIWIGCKSDKNKKLVYSLYTKDENGKKVNEPIIDGVKATPSKYLEALQTELTWRLDELTSENPTVQKKILLSMYQHAFKKLGVVFDKKSKDYEGSILDQIDKAETDRSNKDSIRKQVGGIKEDLKAKGFDVERPATIPEEIVISEIDTKIKEQEKERTIEETNSTSNKDLKLEKVKNQGMALNQKSKDYNSKQLAEFNDKIKVNDGIREQNQVINQTILDVKTGIAKLKDYEIVSPEYFLQHSELKEPALIPEPEYIRYSDDKKVITTGYESKELIDLMKEYDQLRVDYSNATNEQVVVDLSKFDAEIKKLETEKTKAIEINKIVDAVHSWHNWSASDGAVKKLKTEYVKMLAKVDTGVEGLKIVPVESEGKLDIFLMYDGSYDPGYFNSEIVGHKCASCGSTNLKDSRCKECSAESTPVYELRKLSSYSGTQKPVICLLIQNYLLSKKEKAMRYMFIDNVPVDKRTVQLLEDMSAKLDLTLFVNITGDFEQNALNDGEILVDGGEVFFKGQTNEVKANDEPKGDAPF